MKTNMMKMKDFRCILIPVLLLTGACTALPRTEGWLEGNPVTVSLSMGVSSFGHAGMAGAGADTGAADAMLQNPAGTRSTSPHTYEVENLIHDIWLIQFNSRGQYVNASYYPREGLAGQVIENESFELMSLSESTVCIVANTMNPDLSWPDNLPAFKRTLLDVGANNELALDRMPMCGYWIGDVTADLSLSVILSRMMTRINLVINNNTGQRLSGIRAELEHIPAKAYVMAAVPLHSAEYLLRCGKRDYTENHVRRHGMERGAGQQFPFFFTEELYSVCEQLLYFHSESGTGAENDGRRGFGKVFRAEA